MECAIHQLPSGFLQPSSYCSLEAGASWQLGLSQHWCLWTVGLRQVVTGRRTEAGFTDVWQNQHDEIVVTASLLEGP